MPVDKSDSSVPASVHPATAPVHTIRCLQNSGCPLPLLPCWLGSIRRRKPGCLFDTPCRTEHGNDSRAIPSLWHVAPPATSERFVEVLGSLPISLSFVASCADLQPRPLPSTGITRLQRYYEPLRHPSRPNTIPRGRLVGEPISADWGFPCCVVLLCRHAIATTPAGSLV